LLYAVNVNNNRIIGSRQKHAASRGFLVTAQLSCTNYGCRKSSVMPYNVLFQWHKTPHEPHCPHRPQTQVFPRFIHADI